MSRHLYVSNINNILLSFIAMFPSTFTLIGFLLVTTVDDYRFMISEVMYCFD